MHMFSNMMQKLKYGTGSFQKAKKLGYTTQYSFKVPKPSCSYVVHPAPYGCAFSIINLPANSKEYARWCLPVVIAEKNSPSFANWSWHLLQHEGGRWGESGFALELYKHSCSIIILFRPKLLVLFRKSNFLKEYHLMHYISIS